MFKNRSKIHAGAVIGVEDRMMKTYRSFCRILIPALLVISAWSCSTDGNIQQLMGTSVEAPVFLDCKPVSSTEIVFTFSQPVRVVSVNFDPDLEVDSVEEGREVKFTFAQDLEVGMKITADILVEDAGRNSLNVIVPFRTRNDRMPVIIFNELRTEYTRPRVEFVEFLVLEAGNLGAMKLFIAGHSLSKPLYEFSPVEVGAGEYIVLHLRTIDEGCVDETGPDLALSAGTDAQDTARDFWIPGSAKLLHKTSALWLMDQDDRIIDAVLLCENSTEWGKNNSKAAAEFLGQNGGWLPPDGENEGIDGEGGWIPGPAAAVNTTGTTATRTICRDESIPAGPRKNNWYITATSSDTAGKPNNPKRYVP